MTLLTFAFIAAPGMLERQALILTASLRTFGGDLADSPVWALVPETDHELSPAIKKDLALLEARFLTFGIHPAARQFPFAAKAWAAAAAESLAQGTSPLLVWMDSDALVLQPPHALLLPGDKALGCRPVDHTLIGSRLRRPVDPFWRLIYKHCGVSRAQLFPVTTTVDRSRIRAYFNAGLLVVRPENRLLHRWRDNLVQLGSLPDFQEPLQQNPFYRPSFHQAVLAGTVLSQLAPSQIHQFSHLVNYPLHMHVEYPPARRPETMNQLITGRYETFFQDPRWPQRFPAREPLQSWLARQFPTGRRRNRFFPP